MQTFRHGQQGYAKQLKKRDDRVKQLRTFGDEEVHQRLETEEKVAGYLEMGYGQEEIKELLLLEDQANEDKANGDQPSGCPSRRTRTQGCLPS